MKPKFSWKQSDKSYSNSYELFAGNWHVASVGWDAVNRQEEKWIVYFRLPGLKDKSAKQYIDVKDAQARAEQIVTNWIKELEVE